MDMNEYQLEAKKTAIFPEIQGMPWLYPALGVAGEAGELVEVVKKVIRDHGGEMDSESRKKISYEMGDVLWYISQLADILGFSLETIATRNLEKLADRQARLKLQGEGDFR